MYINKCIIFFITNSKKIWSLLTISNNLISRELRGFFWHEILSLKRFRFVFAICMCVRLFFFFIITQNLLRFGDEMTSDPPGWRAEMYLNLYANVLPTPSSDPSWVVGQDGARCRTLDATVTFLWLRCSSHSNQERRGDSLSVCSKCLPATKLRINPEVEVCIAAKPQLTMTRQSLYVWLRMISPAPPPMGPVERWHHREANGHVVF